MENTYISYAFAKQIRVVHVVQMASFGPKLATKVTHWLNMYFHERQFSLQFVHFIWDAIDNTFGSALSNGSRPRFSTDAHAHTCTNTSSLRNSHISSTFSYIPSFHVTLFLPYDHIITLVSTYRAPNHNIITFISSFSLSFFETHFPSNHHVFTDLSTFKFAFF